MDTSKIYGQENFNLPHDVVPLPSQGKFYPSGKKSLKIGYLTASDENLLMSQNTREVDSLITSLLRSKIYEPDISPEQLLEGDAEAILIFLRNTAFGPYYKIKTKDPKSGELFEVDLNLESLNFKELDQEPDSSGHFTFKLPKSGNDVKVKLLTMGDQQTLRKIRDSYPKGMVVPIVTKRLEMNIVSVDGNEDRNEISRFVNTLPIADSKFIRAKIEELSPRLDLNQEITAPSGEKVQINVTFGAEFFRPFFWVQSGSITRILLFGKKYLNYLPRPSNNARFWTEVYDKQALWRVWENEREEKKQIINLEFIYL